MQEWQFRMSPIKWRQFGSDLRDLTHQEGFSSLRMAAIIRPPTSFQVAVRSPGRGEVGCHFGSVAELSFLTITALEDLVKNPSKV